MVPVTSNKVLYVAFEPFVKIVAVAVWPDLAFRDLPFVKSFIHHQEAHAVTQIQKFSGHGIMTGTNGIAAHFPQNLEPPLPDSVRHRSPDAAAVMVQADAV